MLFKIMCLHLNIGWRTKPLKLASEF
uniref:Uncharacterized protein n=1 Tax=Anguilla anguilla TaxID=7936 RepID=A0A0E9SGS5_ANGAN